LADLNQIQRDIPYFQQLGINTIRVYQSNPNNNHDAVMSALAAAGIYVILDVPDPTNNINRIDPQWTTTQFDSLKAKIDAFVAYPNILLFIAGNEVSNDPSTTKAAPFVKASVRDLKAYIKSLGYSVGVGYAAADVPSIRIQLQQYFNCGNSTDSADWYGVNIYEWCGASSFQGSGYAAMTKSFGNWSIPVILTEYGCNRVMPRVFTEVASIYGPDMEDTISGGPVFEYSQEENAYGLVTINVASNTVTPNQDFDNLKSQLAKVNPQGVTLSEYNVTNPLQECPPITSSWFASPVLPPTPNDDACTCMLSQLKCVTKATTSSQANGTLINQVMSYICTTNSSFCDDVAADPTNGVYGKYSMCPGLSQVSYALNQYYLTYGGDQGDSACTFNGLGKVVTPTTDSSVDCGAVSVGSPSSSVHLPQTSFTTAPDNSTSASSTSAASSSAQSTDSNSTTSNGTQDDTDLTDNDSSSSVDDSDSASGTMGSDSFDSSTSSQQQSVPQSSDSTNSPQGSTSSTQKDFDTSIDGAASVARVTYATLIFAAIALIL
jgi:hypothetical protein